MTDPRSPNGPQNGPQDKRAQDTLLRYVLGELSEAETLAVERRLERDPEARARVLEMSRTLEHFVNALPEVQPPERVWQGISARVSAARVEPSLSLPMSAPPHETLRRPLLKPALFAFGLALLGLGLWQGVRLSQEAARHGTILAGTKQDQILLERYQNMAGVRRKVLKNAQGQAFGTVLLSPNDTALYVLDVPPPTGKTYQAWGRKGETLVSLGQGEGRTVEVSGVIRRFESIGVSLEPRGGSPRPTQGLGRISLL